MFSYPINKSLNVPPFFNDSIIICTLITLNEWIYCEERGRVSLTLTMVINLSLKMFYCVSLTTHSLIPIRQ